MASKSYKYLLYLLVVIFSYGNAKAGDLLPDEITVFTGAATYCQGDVSSLLSVDFSTCKAGTGRGNPFPITVTWYSNTTNSTSGGTQVSQSSSTTGTTTYTYSPSTGSAGTLYYYVEISWAGGASCNGPSPLSTSTFTPSTLEVIVNPPTPAQPGAITPSTPSPVPPSTSGLVYNISDVTDATTYTWTVPSGWTINSGQGTTSISVTSGTTGGDITVTADNSCGNSPAQTLAVTIAANPPTITLGPNPSVVEGTTTADLTYSATTNSPDQYSIDYDATAEGEGFSDVILDALPASPIVLVVPGAAAPATYNATLTVTNSGTVLSSGDYPITVTITPGTPTITITDADPSVVQGTTTADITYSGTTFSPDEYSIDYDGTAEGEGFVDVVWAALPASPIVLSVPVAAAVATYNGTLTVRNSGTGAVSGNYAITVTVTAAPSPPTITLGPNPSVVEGITAADLTYSATTESPDQYSLDYDAIAEGEGFSDVILDALPASPIVLVVPGAAAPATYNATLTVTNSGTTLTSGDYPITVTITPGTPTITITDANPSVVQGTTTADITYSGTTFSPDEYSIDYDAAANAVGFVDVADISLPASPIVLTVPGAAAIDTYNGTLTVRNSGTGAVSGNYAITISITAAPSPPTITLGPNPSVVEGITAADLTYSATTNSPDQYSIDYDATAEGEGFSDVILDALPASPIVLVVPGAAIPATYSATLTVTNSGTVLSSGDYPITVTITPGTPTITITDANPSVVQGTTTADITYSATTFSPDEYSIDYDGTAEGEGFLDVIWAALPASPIVLTVPGAAAIDTYNGTLTVRNSGTGAVSGNYAITVTVTAAASPPTITLGPNPSVVEGITAADLTYSATTESPDQYSIDYDATAEGEGFSDVTFDALPASPIVLVVPGAAAPATYNATLTVTNSGTTLTSGDYPITVTITPGTPTITITDANPSVDQGTTTADITYSATTFSPDEYSIDYDGTAEGEGFVDVVWAALPASPIVLTIPAAAAVATYNGTLTVRNSGTGVVSENYAITITITSSASPPTITLGANPTVCQGTTTADLPYSASTESPDQYSIDYSAAANGEGFSDVVNALLPGSPIELDVPGGAATGTYSGTLTVRNSGTGLSSGAYIITVDVISTPSTPLAILGSTSVPESTTGLSYSVVDVDFATTYTWNVPSGWSITSGQGTSSITVTSGATGEDGNITVTAGNICGTSGPQTLAVTTFTPSDHSVYGCNACHITHEAAGGSLTSTLGNANLCLSCHVTNGAGANKPFSNADKAIPGTSGNSHAWDVASVNSTYETVLTSDPEMLKRVDTDNNDNITCSTCHNQHNSNTNPSYLRISNSGDVMCKDCHSPRNVGRYADNISNKGSHPVGLDYTGTGDFESSPSGAVVLVGGKIECSSCHQTHYAATSDGTLLRQPNDNSLCTSCHTLGTHNGMSCNDCHQTHNTNKDNIYMIKNTIATPNSGDRTVVFTALTGTNSFADGDGTYDGVCEVCHTSTLHFQNDGTSSDQNHTSSGGPMNGQNCKGCHPHNSNFSPAGGSCDDCHNTQAPTFGSAVHVKHKDTYGYTCSTCHFGHGSGGASEGSHPSGTIDVVFDGNGMATRNGQDAISPVMNGDNTCDNIYCHSDGRSAYRGMDGTYTWSGTTGSQTAVYATTPAWGSGTITTCMPCHSGTGNMTDPYTITTPGIDPTLPPSTGSHRRGAHLSNSQENDGNGWDVVNCFWCHNTANGDDGSPILQGTYGSSFHVDGSTYFDPRSYVDGGTLINNPTGGSFSYSFAGSSGHCGDGKTCW